METVMICPECDGTGIHENFDCYDDGTQTEESVYFTTCQSCQGTGVIEHEIE